MSRASLPGGAAAAAKASADLAKLSSKLAAMDAAGGKGSAAATRGVLTSMR